MTRRSSATNLRLTTSCFLTNRMKLGHGLFVLDWVGGNYGA